MTYRLATVNGETGLIGFDAVRPCFVLTIETDGLHILAAYTVVNPDKLGGIAPLQGMSAV